MRSEGGQASVEWIGLVLLVALALGALVRFAPGADAEALGPQLLHAIGCAARGGCEAPGGDRAGTGGPARRGAAPHRLVSAPPLVPIAPREPGSTEGGRTRSAPDPRARSTPRPRWRAIPDGLLRARPLVRGRALVRRAGRGAGVLWRRLWILCLGYERARYGFLHPEIRFPHVPIPLSEDLRMANDCLSPVDFVRDWDLFRGGR